ncbi:MAG: ferritin-like domain-containing protein [Deltaproteobacteria bacterium]|nr:ferritin-like domain-containing protein [Deltaproteobacteria bacterium]
MRLNSLEEILRFAIRKEADAATAYRIAADRAQPGVKKFFEELAEEEEKHKKKLEAFDLKKIGRVKLKETQGLGMSERMDDIPFGPELTYEELLRMAIKNEEKSQNLYTSTSKLVTDSNLKKLLLILAQEESTHKARLEKIYDDEILTEF